MIIEICATTIKSVLNANMAGADRIELCSNYNVGGFAPNVMVPDEAVYKPMKKESKGEPIGLEDFMED